MNKTLKSSLIIIAFLFVIIGLAFGINALVKPIITSNDKQEKIGEYSKLLNGIDDIEDFDEHFEEYVSDEFIIDQQVALNNKKEIIGYLYKAQGTNQWGRITIIAAIDDSGKILGIDSVVDQSLRKDEMKDFISKHKESSINNPQAPDGVSGPTTKDSITLADKLLASIASAHEVVEVSDPYLAFFISGYDELVEDATFTATTITLSRKIVMKDGVTIGHIYSSKLGGFYHDDEEGLIVMDFILDENDLLLGYIEIEYEHTGSYYRHVKKYLNNLKGIDIKGYELIDADVDNKTEATNSVKVIGAMLEDIKEVITNE